MNEEELKIKADLAARIFDSLAEHKGTGVLDYLISHTVDATNEIWRGIQK
jgi:hypothetical protein